MPDRDPLQQLASFGTGGPVDPLPAAEVRRLGDRRRARRTAASVATGVVAVLAVVVPAGLYAAHDGGGRPLPPSSSTPARATTIPDDFPLDRGAYDFGAEGSRKGPNPDVAVKQPLPCGADPLHARQVRDRLGFANLGIDFEDYRQLLLYADEADASEVMGAAAAAVEGCPTEPDDGMTLLWTTMDADTGYETLTFRQGVQGAVGGTTYQLTRVGRAILEVAWNGEGGGDVPGQTAVTTAIAPEMCGWADGGCTAVPSDGVSEAPTDGGAREIADDFPLAVGFPERSERGEEGYTGPNRTIDPVAYDLCGKPMPDRTHRDRLLARYESAEDYRTRQLTTYADAAAAVAASRAIIQAFKQCPTEGPDSEGYTSEREVERLALGGESWVVLDRATYEGGETPFGSTLVVVRVGRAVLIEDHGGHAGYPDPEGVRELGERLAAPIAAMCVFTAAGC